MLPEIRAKGATLVTLSPQLPEFAHAWVEEDGIGFDVLLDLGLGVARDYGLTFRLPDDLRAAYAEVMNIDLVGYNGDDSWELPIPATFVVDAAGTVVFASADPDYTVQPEPADVVAAIPSAV